MSKHVVPWKHSVKGYKTGCQQVKHRFGPIKAGLTCLSLADAVHPEGTPWILPRLDPDSLIYWEGGNRGWDAWMASPTQWTRVWANPRRWWRTGKPGVLQSMGLQRVRHNLLTEQQQMLLTPVILTLKKILWFFSCFISAFHHGSCQFISSRVFPLSCFYNLLFDFQEWPKPWGTTVLEGRIRLRGWQTLTHIWFCRLEIWCLRISLGLWAWFLMWKKEIVIRLAKKLAWGRPQWQTKEDLGMPGLGPRSPGYSNSLILRAFELGTKGERAQQGVV